jgi:hypothetical protein
VGVGAHAARRFGDLVAAVGHRLFQTVQLWLAPPGSFRLRASGTFFDALAHGRPLIYTANPYIAQYLAGPQAVGVRCASVEDVARAVLDVAATHTTEAYGAQRAAIMNLRERFSPVALAGRLPAALESDF